MNPQRQHAAIVFPAMSPMLMARPYGIAMTAFTIDVLAVMLTDHVVTSQFQNV
jgi:hypothetical protein